MRHKIARCIDDTRGTRWTRLTTCGGGPARAAAIAVTLLVLPLAARARAPAEADPVLRPWFEDLKQPGSGVSCCSVSDCRRTEYRIREGGYEVEILGLWLPVPRDRVLQRGDNPTGHAVVCWLPTEGVMCFVRPSDS